MSSHEHNTKKGTLHDRLDTTHFWQPISGIDSRMR